MIGLNLLLNDILRLRSIKAYYKVRFYLQYFFDAKVKIKILTLSLSIS